MKKKISLIFVSIFLMLGIVCGALVFNADTLFLQTSTEEVEEADEEKDEQTRIQASGNWSDYKNDYWSKGTKNGRTVRTISTAQELATLAYDCNSPRGNRDSSTGTLYSVCGMSGYNAIDVYLENDIDMSAHYWDCPIGNGSHPFSVNFYGQGHTISGLYFNMTSSQVISKLTSYEGKYGVGLFGVVSGNASFQALTLSDGSFVLDTNSAQITVNMGGLVGMSTTSSSIKVFNVINCMSTMEIFNENAKNSYNGGIVGYASNLEVSNCYNFSKIEARSNTCIGGIVGGVLNAIKITSCGNFGEVYAWLWAGSGIGYGGIIGIIGGNSDSCVEDCVNYGKVWAEPSSTSYTSSYVGGIVGAALNNTYVNRCINYGEVKATSYVGGIAGLMSFPLAGHKCLISNCINYNKNIAGEYSGKIFGYMGGSENVQACYAIGSGSLYGAWYGQSSCAASNIDWWENSTYIWQAGFFRYPSSSNGHDYDFKGTQNYYVKGWKDVKVDVNGQSYSGWIITTLIYDYYGETSSISKFNLNKKFPYSLVPASLIGTGTLNVKYTMSGSATHDFDNDETDETYMKIKTKFIFGDQVYDNGSLFLSNAKSYTNGTFFYIRGFKNSSINTLRFTYNTDHFKFKTMTTNPSGLSASMKSDTYVSSSSRVNNLSFDPKGNSSITFNVVFQSQPKQLNFVYKIARLKESDGNTDATYTYLNINTSCLNEFFTQSSTTTNYYYKQNVNHTVTPNKGYAVLSIINRDSNNTTDLQYGTPERIGNTFRYNISDSRSVCEGHNIVASMNVLGGTEQNPVGYYEALNPSNFGAATTNYKYLYDTSTTNKKQLVIYIVPIRYQNINVTLDKIGDDDKYNSASLKKINNNAIYAFEGQGGVYVPNSNGARSRFRNIRLSNFYDNSISTTLNSINCGLFRFGYKYTLNGFSYSTDRVTHKDKTGSLMSITNNRNIQLDTNRSIVFSMQSLLNVAVPSDSYRANQNLHIVVIREEINYTVNINNMVDSYRYPGTYSQKTNMGGNSMISNTEGGTIKFVGNVDDTAYYSFVPKPGYFYRKTNLDESENDVDLKTNVDFFSMAKTSSGDDVQHSKLFQILLERYMDKICDNNVDRLSKDSYGNYILIIDVYYTLQQYSVTFKAEVDGSQRSASYTFTPTNFASAQTKNSTNFLSATGTTYYYAPVTLQVNNVNNGQQNVKFLGWYMGNNLLSLEREYKFVLNPEYATGRITNINTNESNYSFNLVAKFASYTTASGNLQTAGNKIVYINNANDLVLLSQNVNSGTTYEGYLIKQTANIDMKDIIFNPIGTEANPFKGTYDGQNHIISNLKFVFNDNYLQNLYNIGLFGYTNGATINNLTIRNSDYKAFGKAGIFVSESYNTNFNYLNNFNSDMALSKVTFFDIYGGEVSSKTLNYANIGGSLPVDISSVNSTSFTWNTELYPLARANFGGLVGSMAGGSAYACSVNASLTKDNKDGNVEVSNFQGFVGSLSSSGKIDQCCVENSVNNSELTVANTSNGVTNSYYRYSSSTSPKFVGTALSGNNPTNTNIWFRLANGNWALRVLYWN